MVRYILNTFLNTFLDTFSCRKCCKNFFFKLGFTPCKAEQPLQGMELQEKEAQKD